MKLVKVEKQNFKMIAKETIEISSNYFHGFPRVDECIIFEDMMYRIAEIVYAGEDNTLIYIAPIISQIEDKENLPCLKTPPAKKRI